MNCQESLELGEYIMIHVPSKPPGAFSSVFLARLKHYPEVSEMFALKHVLPTTHPARIENELRCLLKLGYICLVSLYCQTLIFRDWSYRVSVLVWSYNGPKHPIRSSCFTVVSVDRGEVCAPTL